jgi:DNA polymerase-3 subunit delta
VANGTVEDLSIGTDKRGRLQEQQLEAFIRERIEAAGLGSASSQLVALIKDRAGSEIGTLAQEIDKLCLACAARGRITASDVRDHVRDQSEAWVFDLTNAISDRRFDRAALLLERLLEQGEAPIRLVALLAGHVADLIEARRVLATVPHIGLRNAGAFARDYFPKLPREFRNRFKSGFRAYYALQGAAAFGFDELRDLHRGLVEADLALKSSRVVPQHLLVEIVEQACASRVQ